MVVRLEEQVEMEVEVVIVVEELEIQMEQVDHKQQQARVDC
jgi:hypothetical protein